VADNIQRRQLENGELKAMIERGDIRGMTSNPSIFNNAISKSQDYDSALIPLAWAGWNAEKYFGTRHRRYSRCLRFVSSPV